MPGGRDVRQHDLTACMTQRKTACLAVNAASKTPPRIFTPGNVGDCINQTNTVYAKTLASGATQTDIDTMIDKCAYVFQGNVASGSPCTVKYDCKDKNQICDTRTASACAQTRCNRTKASRLRDPVQFCAPDSYCAMDSTTGSLHLPGQGRPERGLQRDACRASTPIVVTPCRAPACRS